MTPLNETSTRRPEYRTLAALLSDAAAIETSVGACVERELQSARDAGYPGIVLNVTMHIDLEDARLEAFFKQTKLSPDSWVKSARTLIERATAAVMQDFARIYFFRDTATATCVDNVLNVKVSVQFSDMTNDSDFFLHKTVTL